MSTLFDMGGYEFYVWTSVGLGLVVMAWNFIAPALQRRAVLEHLAEEAGTDDTEASS